MNGMRDLRAEADRLKAGIRIADVIGHTVPLKRDGRLWRASCPFHTEMRPSFYVYADHFHCFGCGAHGDLVNWTMAMGRMTFPEAVAHLAGAASNQTHQFPQTRSHGPIAPPADVDAANRRELARHIWIESVDPRGTIAETYLGHRGVRLPDRPVIRFSPACPRKGGALPAMIALLTDPVTGAPCGVHRTFLAADGSGKASIEKSKMMLGTAGIIRLDEPSGDGLGLAEGIETALSVSQRLGWRPVWAAGSAGGIERFPLLYGHSLTIFADHDGSGLKAARSCAERWREAGHPAAIHIPPQGQDWADATAGIAE